MTNQLGIYQKRHYDRKRKEVFYSSREYFSLTVLPFLLSFFERPLSTDLFCTRQKPTQQETKEKRENNCYKSFVAWWYYQYDIAVVVVVVVVVVTVKIFRPKTPVGKRIFRQAAANPRRSACRKMDFPVAGMHSYGKILELRRGPCVRLLSSARQRVQVGKCLEAAENRCLNHSFVWAKQ